MYQKSKSYDQMFKFLIIGDSEVGKTNLMLRFCEDNYSDTHIATIGVDFKFKEIRINEKVIKMQIWDTAGQERFRTLTQSYYKGAYGILLVYSINDLKSFQDIENWIQNVKTHAKEDIQIILIGNKCDMKTERVVTTDQGKNIADQYGLQFFETSAKENINVEKAFIQIATMVQQIQEQKQTLQVNSLDTRINESKKLTDYKKSNNNHSQNKKKCCD